MSERTNRNPYDDEIRNDGVFDLSGESPSSPDAGSAAASEIGLEERLTEILVDERDGDLLLQRSTREGRVLQWLQALDLQVIGACRTDERLMPLLKMNASNGVAEDRLLAHLSQHFEPVEVGMLARCFCIPLVSVRVGKIIKQGTILCPTNTRGDLNLTVLPTSDLRLSFVGDDGSTERLYTLSTKSQCSDLTVHEIAADNSGRSFLMKVPDGKTYYFWCSEKSNLLGVELLAKMKDLVVRKPSIADLTGISEARLGCFATHLRAYLVGSTIVGASASLAVSHMHQDASSELSDIPQDGQFLPASSKSLRSRNLGNLTGRANPSFQGSLSPRSSSFKDGLSRSISSLKTSSREKLKRRGDNLSAFDNTTVASTFVIDGSLNHTDNENVTESGRGCSLPSSCFLDSLTKLAIPQTPKSESQIQYTGTLLSPYYCWCPPGVSTLRFSAEISKLPSSSTESSLLPPLSSLLPASLPSNLLTQTPPFNLVDSPSLDFPAFFPDPLVRLPRPTVQQIPTFTPLICDPIVHIPVIDVCSSGPGYLVTAGPSLSTTIPPLHPNIVSPLLPKTDSMVEKGARETLRLLIGGSSQTNPPLMMDAFPAVLTQTDENPNVIVAGSRGLYATTRDVDVIASSIAAIRLVSSLSGRSDAEAVARRCSSHENCVEDGSCAKASCAEDGASFSHFVQEERTDE